MKVATAAIGALARQKRKEFTIGPSKFPADAEKKKLQTKAKEGDPSFTVELHVVSGTETAEQAVLWLKKLHETFILGKAPEDIPWAKMRGHLQALTKDEAQNVVTAAYTKLLAITEVVPENYDSRQKNQKNIFRVDNRVDNLYARKLLEDTFDTKAKIEAMTANESKEFHEASYKEAIWKLSLMFFGDDPYGRNNSLGLKRVMSKLTPDPRTGIEKYKSRMSELNSYLPYCLWEAGMKKNGVTAKPRSLADEELRDRLCDNLNVHQRTYLKQNSYNWFEESYSKTVATLALGEDRVVEAMDKAKENAKAAKASKTTGTKRKNDTVANGSNKKTKCPHCHKFHKGPCRLKGKPGDKTLQGKKSEQDINQLAAKVAEQLNSMQSQSSKPGWASGLDTAKFETICALYRAAHNLEPYETIDTMDTDELKHFKEVYQIQQSANFK